jgi:8-oxo-dGTP pyrophosphatase MutT (NUDIX family)
MYTLDIQKKSALAEIIETSFRSIPSDLLPVLLHDQIIGYVTPAIFQATQQLLNEEEQSLNFIHCYPDRIIIENTRPHTLSVELRILAEHLKHLHLIDGWRNEEFSFMDEVGHERFRVERTFFRAYGFQSTAVHINGYTNNGKIWLAKRSSSKHIDPNLLDNITAGGVSANETLMQCAIRELNEEAGISFDIAQELMPIGAITVRRGLKDSSLHHETLYTYDLEVPDSFRPKNQDQEVSEFILVDFAEALDLVLNEQLTIDAGVVTADFLLRHC